MKTTKPLFVLATIGILILLILAQTKPSSKGTIASLTYSTNKITITLEETKEELIMFENKILPLQKGDNILYTGTKETYKNKKQIILETIQKERQPNQAQR